MGLRGIQIQERDTHIFKVLQKYGYLHALQIRKLCFEGTKEKAVYNRLKKLCDYGYIKRIVPDSTPDSIHRSYYYITEKVRYFLDNDRSIKRFHSKHIRHDVGLSESMIHLTEAYPEASIHTETDLGFLYSYVFKTAKVHKGNLHALDLRFLPDGAIQFPEILFFIEYDRSTEWGMKMHQKLFAYEEYVKSQRYKNDFGADIKKIRILMLCKGEDRMRGLMNTYKTEISLKLFIFTTHEDFLRSQRPLHSHIWEKIDKKGKIILGKVS